MSSHPAYAEPQPTGIIFPAYAEPQPTVTGPFQMEYSVLGFRFHVMSLQHRGALSKIRVRNMLSELYYIISQARPNCSALPDFILLEEVRDLDSQLDWIPDNQPISNDLWMQLNVLLERVLEVHFRCLTLVDQNFRAHTLCTVLQVPQYLRRHWNIHTPV